MSRYQLAKEMRVIRIILICLVLASAQWLGWGAEAEAGEKPAEHGLPPAAVELWKPFGFPITNSMLVTWIVAVGLIVFAQMATRKMQALPSGAQNFWEWL